VLSDPDVVGACVFGSDQAYIERCQASPKPVLDFSAKLPEAALPRVLPDHRQGGRLAAEHLLSTGIRQFVYIGTRMGLYGRLRGEGFRTCLQEHDFDCEVCADHPTTEVFDRLETQPPMGVLCANDRFAGTLTTTVMERGLRIPEDIAIMGIDDSTLQTEQEPRLTSVATPGHQVGLSLGRQMAAWIDGQEPKALNLVPYTDVVIRASTDVFLGCSPEVTDALRHLRRRACDTINVEDVVRETGVSRRSLDRHAKRLFGHSTLEEILRLRIVQAKRLLADEGLTVAQVAARCGFEDTRYFHRVFRKHTGMSPRELTTRNR
jgi:LacI family transcriptional regulator